MENQAVMSAKWSEGRFGMEEKYEKSAYTKSGRP